MSEKEFNPETDLKFSIDKKIKEKFERLEKSAQAGVTILGTNESVEVPAVNAAKANFPEMLGGQASPKPTPVQMRAFASQIDKIKSRIVLFDYKTNYYEEMLTEEANVSLEIVKEFEELPKMLKEEKSTVLFLNYSGYPRLCNQMIPLVKEKFKHVKIVLTAKLLTPEKVKAHRESELAVHDYLNMPFTLEDFYRVLLKYN